MLPVSEPLLAVIVSLAAVLGAVNSPAVVIDPPLGAPGECRLRGHGRAELVQGLRSELLRGSGQTTLVVLAVTAMLRQGLSDRRRRWRTRCSSRWRPWPSARSCRPSRR